MMAYTFTFTPRFQKHFKSLTVQEKKQLKNKLQIFLSAVSTWVDVGHHDILNQF